MCVSYSLPLFPLSSVLFPGGQLGLRVFEARYLDLMTACIKTESPFGVVCIKRGSEIKRDTNQPEIESIGCHASLIEWDMPQAGLMVVRCKGLERFEVHDTRTTANGLVVGTVSAVEPDVPAEVSQQLQFVQAALKQAISNITARNEGPSPFIVPYDFKSAAWVANRWCELLPIPVHLKQQLMALQDAGARLKLVAGFLQKRGIAA
jgi:uncharacterized protein